MESTVLRSTITATAVCLVACLTSGCGDDAPASAMATTPTFYQVEKALTVRPRGVVRMNINCNEGDAVTGGGYFLNTSTLADDELDVEVFANLPIITVDIPDLGSGWDIGIHNKTATERTGFGYALCVHD